MFKRSTFVWFFVTVTLSDRAADVLEAVYLDGAKLKL